MRSFFFLFVCRCLRGCESCCSSIQWVLLVIRVNMTIVSHIWVRCQLPFVLCRRAKLEKQPTFCICVQKYAGSLIFWLGPNYEVQPCQDSQEHEQYLPTLLVVRRSLHNSNTHFSCLNLSFQAKMCLFFLGTRMQCKFWTRGVIH